MAAWILEPGHTAAEFRVRHMMVTWVRGHFKDVHGRLEFDPTKGILFSLEATIDAAALWTGEPQRDAHLRSADFLDVAAYPTITFASTGVERTGAVTYRVAGLIKIRGKEKAVTVDLRYLGRWRTPYDAAQVSRVGFSGKTQLNRHDFGVSWNSAMEEGGLVVGNDVAITIDTEGILASDLEPILAAQSSA